MTLTSLLIALTFILLNVALFVTVSLFMVRRSKRGRPPIGKNFKLLRIPGETLQEQLQALDEKLETAILHGMFAPVLIVALPLIVYGWLKPATHEGLILWALIFGFAISFAMRVRSVTALLRLRKNLRLGLLGERVVAEYLQPLTAKEFHVFHDMPAQGANKAFNLDHVVVGPSGLFVIETKARRKPNTAAQNGDHKVAFDGSILHWPMGIDMDSPQQAWNNAQWLHEWVKQKLGIELKVIPILVLPGWWVDRKDSGVVLVVNEKELEKTILGRPVLDEKTVDQVRRQLDSHCRTVPFEN